MPLASKQGVVWPFKHSSEDVLMLQNRPSKSNAKSAQKCTVYELQFDFDSVKMASHSMCLVAFDEAVAGR